MPEFNYLSPTRRETAAVHNIGGDNLPVVIAARLDGDMDFNPQFVPDYIYTGRSIPEQLPGRHAMYHRCRCLDGAQ